MTIAKKVKISMQIKILDTGIFLSHWIPSKTEIWLRYSTYKKYLVIEYRGNKSSLRDSKFRG